MLRSFAVPVLLVLICGCAGNSHTPQGEDARLALKATLDAWKDGKRPGVVTESAPRIQATDFQWSANQPLESYEIKGEESTSFARIFTVSLKLGKPTRQVEAIYHVLGHDDIMIYRDEDFARAMNMDNSPKSKPEKKR